MGDERTYRMELKYDGTGLQGWAKQPGAPTVEGYLEDAFKTVVGHAPYLRVAGRTDAGVHARRQVVSLQLPAGVDHRRLLGSLNALTPDGIAITRLVPAPPSFDARKDAVSRAYRYHISPGNVPSPFWRPFSWSVPGRLDLDVLREGARLVVGRHDFTAFTPTVTEHTFFHRLVLSCSWRRGRGGVLVFDVESEAFLRHMVRALVGTMVDVGQGRRTLEDFGRLLMGAPRDEAGLTAPACGLFLWNIKY
jgi:tRNA pseudouridine38-40 synthase